MDDCPASHSPFPEIKPWTDNFNQLLVDPYNSSLWSLYNWIEFHPQQIPKKKPTKTGPGTLFFMAELGRSQLHPIQTSNVTTIHHDQVNVVFLHSLGRRASGSGLKKNLIRSKKKRSFGKVIPKNFKWFMVSLTKAVYFKYTFKMKGYKNLYLCKLWFSSHVIRNFCVGEFGNRVGSPIRWGKIGIWGKN